MLTNRREKRKSPRRRTRYAAWISFAGSPAPIPCVLWDMSQGGARLTAAHSEILPESFTLNLDDENRLCRVMWRKKPYVGVQFISSDA